MMKDIEKTTQPEGTWRSNLAAILVVLLTVAASVAAIVVMKAQEVPALDNDTAWLEAYISEHGAIPLSEQQKRIIHTSAAITSAVAEDAGVTVKLQAVCGNGYQTYYKLEVELSEDVTAGRQYTGIRLGDARLKINDAIGVVGGGAFSQTLEDDDPNDNRFFSLLGTRMEPYPGFDYTFDNGIIRTLHLGTLRLIEAGGEETLIEGQWDFGVLFRDRGETIELVQEPVLVRGFEFWEKTYYEANITSFVLTEFSMSCRYEIMPNSQRSFIGFNPIAIMKDGQTVRMNGNGGSGGSGSSEYRWSTLVPIALNEIAFVKLTDNVVLPVSPIR